MSTAQPSSTATSPYEDHFLGAPDVCSNCLRLIRVERVDPTRNSLGGEYETSLERHRRHTDIGYGPADSVSEQKGVFCECGVESARHREWSPTDVDRDRFRELVKELVRTADAKDISIKRKKTVAYALQHFDDHGDVDRALATGLKAGIVAAATGD